MANPLTWHDVLADEKQQPYFLNTLQTVAAERQSGIMKGIYASIAKSKMASFQKHGLPVPCGAVWKRS